MNATSFEGELGLQFFTHSAPHYGVQQWVHFAEIAHRNGFDRIWINDNAGYRSPLLLLTAIASRVPISLGTAILVPYFHHPLDLAGSLASVADLCEGRDFRLGLARGNLAETPHHVEVYKPVTMIKETAGFLRHVLAGKIAHYSDFPVLAHYFRLNPAGVFELFFQPVSSFSFYGGGMGAQSLRVTGESLDGIISSGTFLPMARVGRQQKILDAADKACRNGGRSKRLGKMCEINVSVASDRDSAFAFPRKQVAQAVLHWERKGFTREEYSALGVNRQDVLRIKKALEDGVSFVDAASLVTEEMIRACYIVGTPAEVRKPLLETCRSALQMGYDQITFAKLGPDYEEALNLLSREVMPELRGR